MVAANVEAHLEAEADFVRNATVKDTAEGAVRMTIDEARYGPCWKECGEQADASLQECLEIGDSMNTKVAESSSGQELPSDGFEAEVVHAQHPVQKVKKILNEMQGVCAEVATHRRDLCEANCRLGPRREEL